MSTPHEIVQPSDLPQPTGYAHAVIATGGRAVYLAGQTAQDGSGAISGTFLEQFGTAAGNVISALRAAGGAAEHLVSLTVFVTDMAAYRQSRRELRELWRRHFGAHYPAMAVIGVRELFDPAALVELQAVAVIP